MKELIKDGWRKPRSIYRSFFGSGVLTIGVIAVVCLLVVLVCHLFETPPPEVNALRYTYAHSGMIVAIASMIFGFTAIHVTLKLNESVKIQEFHQRYSGELALKAIRAVADVGRMWDRKEVVGFGRPEFEPRSPVNNSHGRIVVKNVAALNHGGDGIEHGN